MLSIDTPLPAARELPGVPAAATEQTMRFLRSTCPAATIEPRVSPATGYTLFSVGGCSERDFSTLHAIVCGIGIGFLCGELHALRSPAA